MKRFGVIAACVLMALQAMAAEPSAGTSQTLAIEKAFISFRIGPPQWMPENRYGELLRLFEKYKGVTDEITFFTSFTHPPLPFDVVRQRCELLAKRIPQAKALGYRAGVNILSTIGHHEENLPNSLSGDFTNVTDIDGGVCRGTFCPNDPRVQQYIRELYKMVAAADPDYIWIDDDVRLAGHMPLYLTCFCDHCLGVFEKESGKKYTRATLKAAFLEGPAAEREAACKAWLVHNRATINRLFALIEQTVHQAKPGLPLGFMTGDRFFEGYDFDNWAKTLAGPANAPVYWRPGGGFYEDSMTTALVGKSHDIGRQVSKLPPWVVSIQSEIENFPYQRLKKASNTTALEAASHIGSGCTGAAFNVLSGNDEPLDEFEPMVARLQKARPFYDLMAKHLGRAEPVGLFTAWNKESALAGAMFSGAGFWGESSQVFEIGLPTAYGPNGAAVTLLFPSSLATMSKEEITKTLATGVYTDVPTLHALNQMGFQELTGLAIDGTLPIDCIEELTDHPLNAPFAGRQRDCRQSFNHAPGFSLKKVDPKAQTLARLVDYGGKEKAATSMAVFENRLGGRICVAGYFPWSFLHSLSKSAQMKSVSRWLSRDRLPAYVGSYHKVNLWARQPGDGRLAVALVNSSFDPADALSLVLRTESDQATVYDMEGKAQVIRADGRDGPYRRFTLPHVEPWSARLVTVDPPQPPKAASETTTNGVRVLRDLAYIGDGHERHQLDLCLPAKSEKPAPIVVWVHGGAWKMGSKEGCPAAWLVTKGYAVASINYRLSQHAIFPAQIQDCKAAIRWLRANAAKYALDAKHVGVWGASAGGHLVALLGTTSNVKAFEGDGGNLDQSSRVQAVIDWFGPSDFVALGAHERKIEQPLSTLLGGLVSENADKARLASPLTHVDKNAAPFLIVHGDKDDIVPLSHSQRLAAALQAAGVDVRLQVLSGSGHGGPAFLSPENVKVIEEFLDKHLK